MKQKMTLWATAAIAALALTTAPTAAMADEGTVYLPAPTQNDVCADGEVYDDAHWNLPEIEGVLYGIYYYGTAYTSAPTWDEYGWETGDQYLVIASPDDWSGFSDGYGVDYDVTVEPSDYGIDVGGNVGWWLPGFEACSTIVTAKAPTWTNPTGPMNLTPVFTETAEYGYTWKRLSNGKVQVNAVAKPGYALTGVTQWAKLDTN